MALSMKTDAGDFDTWLQSILASFKTGTGIDVPCGECRGCCSAGRFIHLLPSDQSAHSVISKHLLFRAPGMPKGHAVMGYLDGGICPMLKVGDCSIYSSRPSTCRTFDCRVLAATGLTMDGNWNDRINERVQTWQFTFSSEDAQRRHRAMRDTATFIQQHATAFPSGRAPTQPTTLAVLAIKVHSVFLSIDSFSNSVEIANAIVTESRRFESEVI